MSEEADDELSHLRQFLYSCPLGLVDLLADGTIELINPVAMQMLQDAAGTPFVANFFTALEQCGHELRNLASAFEAPRGTICDGQRIFVKAGSQDGAVDPKVLSCSLVKLSGQRLMACLTDVSHQVAQERRLRQAETWFSTLLGDAGDYETLHLDQKGRIESVAPALLKQTGLSAEAVIGDTLDVFDALDSDDVGPLADEMITVARDDGWYLDERWVRDVDEGRRRHQRLVAVRKNSAGEAGTVGYMAVLRSVAGPSFDADKLRRLLRTDHLTGATNRAYFFEVAERTFQNAKRTGEPLSVVAIDLDLFKRINDTYGHSTGDEVLSSVAATCRAVLRPIDTFARVGGEEFVAFLPGVGGEDALVLAERVRRAVAALEFQTESGPLKVTASLGSASQEPSVTSLASLLAQADQALYAAKRAGRDRVREYDPAIVLG